MLRRALLAVVVLGVCSQAPNPSVAEPRFTPPVVDLHVDLPYQITAKQRPAARGDGNYVAEWLKDAGIAAAVLPLYVPRDAHPQGPTLADFERVFTESGKALQALPQWTIPGFETPGAAAGRNRAQARSMPCDALGSTDRTVGFYSFEGLEPLAFDLPKVDLWASRGVRLFGLVHSYDTQVASSSGYHFTKASFGLTRLGKQVVSRIYDAGGIVDVSHASDETVADVLSYALERKVPVVATHSNARAIAHHARNLTDGQIRLIAETGGVVGVAFHARFLTGGTRTKLSDVVKHILHIKRVAGIGAIAIGSDFEGGIRPPPELADVRGFGALASALLEAGLAPREVEQIFAGNALRVLCPTTSLPAFGKR
jgi:membrane dipeptidase